MVTVRRAARLVRVVRGGLANIFQVVSMADDENVVGLNGFAVGASLSRLRYLTQARMNILWHGKKAGGCRITYLHIESSTIAQEQVPRSVAAFVKTLGSPGNP